VKWQTASEINSSHFNVQRSTDGRIFHTIESVVASNASMHQYSITDNKLPSASIIYYRLEMVDKDNKFTFSKTLPVRIQNDQTVMLYPTLITGSQQLTAAVVSSVRQNVSIVIVNAEGKVVLKTLQSLATGKQVFTINTAALLAPGDYYVRVIGEDINQAIKIVKQ
jgi:hypothetical protein